MQKSGILVRQIDELETDLKARDAERDEFETQSKQLKATRVELKAMTLAAETADNLRQELAMLKFSRTEDRQETRKVVAGLNGQVAAAQLALQESQHMQIKVAVRDCLAL